MGNVLEILMTATLVAVLAYAFYMDARYRRIPNHATLPAMGAGLALNTLAFGPSGLAVSLTGLLLGFAILVVPFALGGLGAGDVKLLTAVGSLGGGAFVLRVVIYMGLVGGFMAVIVLLRRRLLLRTLTQVAALRSLPTLENAGPQQVVLPYGVAIALGTLFALVVR